MLDYLFRSFTVWLIGFFPWAEIYVAVPAGFGLGLDIYSVVLWSTFGNYVPAVIIARSYDTLNRYPRISRWLQKFSSPRIRSKIEKNGVWTTIILTPWLGIWAMAATVKIFGMKSRPFLWASFVSIIVYAVILAVLINWGFDLFI
ncbi:MAG: small multi-drug export protein [Bacteroidales bacterium]